LHSAPADWSQRQIRILNASSPALVLGSHQSADRFDSSSIHRAGLSVARRPSAGGAVLIGSGEVLWVDFIVPANDPLWDDDVRRSAYWVGDAWAAAIKDCGYGEPEVWRGALQRGTWSDVICFAGLGPGEVTLSGRKVVGVSQRRTRNGALFQTAAMLVWTPEAYLRLLAEPTVDSDLRQVAAGLGAAAAKTLEHALMQQLVT
jgi:lipoate-protein ligase A